MGKSRLGLVGGVWFFFIVGSINVLLGLKSFMSYAEGGGRLWLAPAVLSILIFIALFVWSCVWWNNLRKG
ncbi:MAG: hypothetical protein QOC61_463 [Acidobacteriota bacterium]|jgi:heme/copper-type cytochrome/quinol oxidase subunit 4|nr:hypothetical protein [Acidobacteriota bacterium]